MGGILIDNTLESLKDMPEISENTKSYVDWYLVFHDMEERKWWARLLRPGFSHVYVIRWDGFNWIECNAGFNFTNINILDCSDPSIDSVLPGVQCTILHTDSMRPIKRWRVPWLVGPQTCVEQIKALLGIRKPFILTPYQLFKHCYEVNHGRILRRAEDQS